MIQHHANRTCLWLIGLPELKRTHFMPKELIKQSVWYESPGINRKANRARTFQSIANAMAAQWSSYVLQSLSTGQGERE
jgi:hypothetical protein